MSDLFGNHIVGFLMMRPICISSDHAQDELNSELTVLLVSFRYFKVQKEVFVEKDFTVQTTTYASKTQIQTIKGTESKY